MKTALSNLPNAELINQILLSLKTDPNMWNTSWDSRINSSRLAAWDAVRNAMGEEAWEAVRDAIWGAVREEAWREAAWEAILGLIAYDRTGSLFDLPPDQVKILAALGDQAAILVEPAVRILKINPN
jgi:hypothetical protein